MARFCPACGHELGVGRFCTNCGQPRPADPAPAAAPAPDPAPAPAPDPAPGPDTEERRAARREAAMAPGPPSTPSAPATADVPPPARFPLWADEQDGEAPDATRPVHLPDLEEPPAERSGLLGVFAGEQTATGLRPVAGPDEEQSRSAGEALARLHQAAAGGEHHPAAPRERRRRGGVVVALVVVLLLALVAVGGVAWLRLRGDDAGADTQAEDPAAAGTDLAPQAEVEVPGTAPPSQEVGGGEVSYAAANLVDGDPETAWRVAGNAAGDRVVLTFPTRIRVTRLGLVNGYAKRSTGPGGTVFDWYHGHRTVTRVVWRLDGGTELPQQLDRTRELQTIDVPPGVTTRRVVLRLEEVAAPGTGRAGRDFTALSEVVVDGAVG